MAPITFRAMQIAAIARPLTLADNLVGGGTDGTFMHAVLPPLSGVVADDLAGRRLH